MVRASVRSVQVGVTRLNPGEASPLQSETWLSQAVSEQTGPFDAFVDAGGLMIELRHHDGRRVVIDLDSVVEQIGKLVF
jgi:hypothetical protein